MSQRQLKLVVSESSNGKTPLSKLNSVRCRMLRAGSLPSPFQTKVARLERERPAAAALIERLVDDVLAGIDQGLPQLSDATPR